MKMKIRNVIYALACAVMTLASCDTVDKNDRYLSYDDGIGGITDGTDDSGRPTSVQRAVLIEDFTGQVCVNCPNAVPVIEGLERIYPGKIVAVAIHAGMVLPPALGNLALQTEVGEQYYNDAGRPAQPAGRIGRVGGTSLPDKWAAGAQDVLRQQSPVWLGVNSAYDAATRKVNIAVEAYGIEAASGNLQIWLTEDGIVAPQFLPDGGRDMNYVHNHVFRAAVNGAYGESFAIAKDEDKTVTAEATLADHWNVDNMSVVAFVYDASGVLHVVKQPVIPEPDETEDADESVE